MRIIHSKSYGAAWNSITRTAGRPYRSTLASSVHTKLFHCPKDKEAEVLQALTGREDRLVTTTTAPKASNPMTQVPVSGTATGSAVTTG